MATKESSPSAAEKTETHIAPANLAVDRKKATDQKKIKEKNASKPRARSTHPTYLEMIGEAITSLKEKTGSSQYAIAKFTEDKHRAHLPSNFGKLLLIQLRKFAASGKLVKVKNSYKLPAKPSKTAVTTPTKPNKAVDAKPKSKLAGATKPKIKAPLKSKPKAVLAAKPNKKVLPAAKPKAAVKVSKPKPKTVAAKPNRRPAKAVKTSAKDAPGKKIALTKKTKAVTVVNLAKTTKKAKIGKSAVKVPVKKALARKAK